MRQNNTTGKSLLFFRNRVNPEIQKYFAGHVGQITFTTLAIPSQREGRWPSSRTRGGMRWTRQRRRADDRGAVFRERCMARRTNGALPGLTRRSPVSDDGGLAKPSGCVRQKRVVPAPVAGVKL